MSLDDLAELEWVASLPWFVKGTKWIPMNQERLANRIASGEGSACWSVPSKSSGSPRRSGGTLEHDSGHIWFRLIVERAGRRIEAELPSSG